MFSSRNVSLSRITLDFQGNFDLNACSVFRTKKICPTQVYRSKWIFEKHSGNGEYWRVFIN